MTAEADTGAVAQSPFRKKEEEKRLATIGGDELVLKNKTKKKI